VFISSTFRDMQAERDWLVRFVFPKLREELLSRRIHLVDVDLRWGVTSDQDALGVCREVIDECHPRFMGLLGGRYGWVPEGREHSITADEVHYGVLDRAAERRGYAFFYFREDSATARMVEESPGEFREPEGSDNARKLADLKKAIAEAALPVFIYPAKWDTTQKRLSGLEVFGNQVRSDLLQSLKDDPELTAFFTCEGSAPPDEFTEEAEQMDAFIEERTDRFVIGSREPLMRDMLTFATADGMPNIFVLTGDPGSGKSAFLAKFTRELATEPFATRHPSFVVPHFIGASTGSTDLRRTLRRLCHELSRAVGNAEIVPLDIKELIIHFQRLLAEAADGRRVILVFDALNQFDATDGAHWLNWLPPQLPSGVRIVVSVIAPAEGQPEHQILAILRTRPGTRMGMLEHLTEADSLAVIKGCLRRYAKRLSPEQLAALKEKPASCLPLYVLTALEELRTLGTYEEITARIRELPGDARALFSWILTERLARDPGFRDREGRPCGAALVEKFVVCLGVSRHGLSPAEFVALLDLDDPLGNVAALLRLLRPYLMRRGELLDFYHGQFREAAEASYLDTPEKQRAAHQSIATCLQSFADPHRDGQYRDATPHALSELPHHQTRAEAWPELIATLENIFFLEAKVTHGMAFDLSFDFADAVRRVPRSDPQHRILRLLGEALRRDVHFIACHAHDYPQALFQCLWNSCWWYDCPSAEGHYVLALERGRHQRPWAETGVKLFRQLEQMRELKAKRIPNFRWLRSVRPPQVPLGTPLIATLRGPGSELADVVFSPNGQRLATVESGAVRLWDASTGEDLRTLEGSNIRMAFSQNDCRVATIEGTDIRVRDGEAGNTIAILKGHERDVDGIWLSPNGRRLISHSWHDQTVRLWNVESAAEIRTITGQGWKMEYLSFSPDGLHIVFTDRSGAWLFSRKDVIAIWDAESGKDVLSIEGTLSGAVFSARGGKLVLLDPNWFLSGSKGIRVVDLPSREVRLRFEFKWFDLCHPTFSPDGSLLAAAGSNDHLGNIFGLKKFPLLLWDIESGSAHLPLLGHRGKICCLAFSPTGRQIATGSSDRAVRVRSVDRNKPCLVLRGHRGEIASVVFSPAGDLLAVSADDTVYVYSADDGYRRTVLRGHESAVTMMAFSNDGTRVVSVSKDRTVRLWNSTEGRLASVLRDHTSNVDRLVISPDTRRVASIAGAEARMWDTRNGLERGRLKKGVWVRTVAYSPDGRFVCIGSRQDRLRIKDTKTGGNVLCLGPEADVAFAAFSHCGTMLASSTGDDEAISLWRLGVLPRTWLGRLLGRWRWLLLRTRPTLLAASQEHASLCFSPNAHFVASPFYNGIALWDLKRSHERMLLQGHRDSVQCIAFSSDSGRLVSGSGERYPRESRYGGSSHDNSVRVWDLKEHRELKRLEGHKDLVTSVAFSPDGSNVAAGSRDGTVRIWDAQFGREFAQLDGFGGPIERVAYEGAGKSFYATSTSCRISWQTTDFQEIERIAVSPLETVVHLNGDKTPTFAFPLPLDHIERFDEGEPSILGTCSNHLVVLRYQGLRKFDMNRASG